jgi:hypothetical protein
MIDRLIFHYRYYRHLLRYSYWETKLLDKLPQWLPARWINHLTAGNLGRLVVTDERLHPRIVPEITIDEIFRAMNVDEGRV